MLGEIAAFEYAVKNQGTMRRTYLVERFEDSGPKTNQILSSPPKTEQIEESPQESKKDSFILTENNLLTIDPMIGLSQADFDTFFKD